MNTGFLDVFHHADDDRATLLPLPPGEGWGEGVLANQRLSVLRRPLTPTLSRGERGKVRDAVHIHFRRGVEELVHENRRTARGLHGVGHVIVKLLLVRDDFHRAPAQHEAGPHEHRVADLTGDLLGFLDVSCDAVGGLLQAELLEQFAELFAITRGVERIHRRADDRNARFREPAREVQRGLSAELHDHAFHEISSFGLRFSFGFRISDFGLSGERSSIQALTDVEDVFMRQRLEEQQVARVVVG